MSQDQSGLVPKNLDNLARFAFWDIYQAMIFLLIFGLSVVFKMILTGIVVGGFLAWGYGRLSSGQSRGFLTHLLYWFTPVANKFKVIPESHKRVFKG